METTTYDSDKIESHATQRRDRPHAAQTVGEAVEAMEPLDDAKDPDDRAATCAATRKGIG